jgi:hypothetical protein
MVALPAMGLRRAGCILLEIGHKQGNAHMTTGKKPAPDASKALSNPKSTSKQKEIAGSDLAQAKRHKPPPKKK